MKFGIFYEMQLPRPWGVDDERQLYQNALEQVEVADKCGYDYAWQVEHHFLEEYSHSPQPEVFLAAASQRTKNIRLGHGIIQLTTNHPARVAEKVATLDLVSNGRVEFIVVGGLAATAHGSARLTQDVDVVYARSPDNLRRLVQALGPYDPYLRGAPPGLPFDWSPATIERGLNFTLTTSFGDLDLLAEITGGGDYDRLLPASTKIAAFGVEVHCLNLEPLIHVMRAAGRPKDLEAIAELQALLEERDSTR